MPNREQLIAFSHRIAEAFKAKQIKAPVHLCSETQADDLIRIMGSFRPGVDWLFGTWRNAFHCLLAGWPEEELFAEILAGKGMYLHSWDRRIFCSSIVGGTLPIAAGVALGIKRNGGRERVYVFVGDMAATTGLFHEFKQFV